MKKLFAFLFLLVLITPNYGQGKKVVLIEEFTNTGCGPCAQLNPMLDSVLNVKLGDAISIKYHVAWPDANDPMYLQNPQELQAKRDYYNVTGVPFVAIDGVEKGSNKWDSYIDERAGMEQAFEIGITYNLSDSKLLTVNSNITASRAISGTNLRFFAVVIEEDIVFDKPTGNGETEFPNVMRKILPDANGFALPTQIAAGQQFSTTDTWQIQDNSFYRIEEMAIVGFIQDLATKEVFQAFYFPKLNTEVDEAEVVMAENMPRRICVPEFGAKVKIRNNGTNNLTSCKLNLSVNGSLTQIVWSGNLKTLESDFITVDSFKDFALNLGGINNVKFWLTDINGTSKSSPEYKNAFYSALTAERQMELLLFTDKKPEEISWKVFNSVGDVIDEGGNYTEQRKTYKQMINFKVDDCYRIVFYDAGSDGICCDNGSGYVKLTQINGDGTTKEMYKGYYSGSEYVLSFSMTNVEPLSVLVANDSKIDIYPNPSSGRFTVSIDSEIKVNAFVYDVTGKMVKMVNDVESNLNLTDLPNGIYAVQFIGFNTNIFRKVIIRK